MKKKRFFFLLVLFLAAFSFVGCAGIERTHEDDTVGMKERLVVKDIGRHGKIFPPRWCGGDGLLFRGDKIGVEMIDLRTGKSVQINNDMHNEALNCSPDGKWVLYAKHTTYLPEVSKMAYEDNRRRAAIEPMSRTVIYRYGVATGKREKVGAPGIDEADMHQGGIYNAMSPDGTKVLLGARNSPNEGFFIDEWEPLWFSEHWWEKYETRWLSDSSGVYNLLNDPDRICIEIFGDDGWAKCFNAFHRYPGNILYTQIDSSNRIYFQVDGFPKAVHRCHIGDKELSCRVIGYSRYFAITPDDRQIFKKLTHKDCIRLASSWEEDGECVADNNYDGEDYVNTTLIGVSPNGRWLAFEREYKRKSPKSADPYWDADMIVDLFVIDLKNE